MSGYLLREVPVGIEATGMRREAHAAASGSVRADRYWGASTQRSLNAGFAATDHLPDRFHRCYGIVKKAAAAANGRAGRLPSWKVEAIVRAADDLIAGRLDDHFPLTVWQSGSGQETDTNVNEVLANRAIQLLGGAIGSRIPIDPAGDVNLGQSLTGMFTTSLQIAIVLELEETLMPSATTLVRALDRSRVSSLAQRLRAALARIDEAEGSLHEIVMGDAPDSSGLSEPDWHAMAASIAGETERPFILLPGSHADPGSLDAVVAVMAAVRGLAAALLDITEPPSRGSSDRVSGNRVSLDAMSMVCINVMGLDQIVASACGRGNRSPRALRPIVAMSVLNAIRTIGQACLGVRRIIAPARAR
ncbi:MAG TPA: lyase family protein [Acetobacteraceae bacterium]|nr:lyase family protein [Acetobacteraceae bacterium]